MAVAHTGMDILFHDSFYVIGHFHVMLAGSAMFASFGAFYFYFPAIFGVKFSRIYGYGVASVIFFHVLVNIGMTIGLVPVIGIPLPFFSYGGSSMMSFSVMMFILLKLDSQRRDVLQ